MSLPFLLPGVVGLALGMRHALEPDHLAAVSTLASERRTPRAGLALGALWGLGHSAALLVVGGTLALFEAQMPPRVESGLEALVGLMVVGLGLRAISRAWREGRTGPVQPHAHGGVLHAHPASGAHVHVKQWTLATRPLLVGVMHGLAGSGALTALVLAELPTSSARLSYIALFGLGSVAGMALLTGLAGASLGRMVRGPRVAAWLLGLSGALSVVVGLAWGVGSASRFFLS